MKKYRSTAASKLCGNIGIPKKGSDELDFRVHATPRALMEIMHPELKEKFAARLRGESVDIYPRSTPK